MATPKIAKCPSCGQTTSLKSGQCLYCGGALDASLLIGAVVGPGTEAVEEPRSLGSQKARFQRSGSAPPDDRAHFLLLPAGDPIELPVGKLFVIGRDSRTNLVIHLPDISRQHCEIDWKGDPARPLLVEVRSRHGTYVNGRLVRRDSPEPLRDGDEIRLGPEFVMIYRNCEARRLRDEIVSHDRDETREMRRPPPGGAVTPPPMARPEAQPTPWQQEPAAILNLPGWTPPPPEPAAPPAYAGGMGGPRQTQSFEPRQTQGFEPRQTSSFVASMLNLPPPAEPQLPFPLEGDLGIFPARMLLETLHRMGSSGVLTIFDGSMTGEVVLGAGNVKRAVFGQLQGAVALEHMALIARGAYRYRQGEVQSFGLPPADPQQSALAGLYPQDSIASQLGMPLELGRQQSQPPPPSSPSPLRQTQSLPRGPMPAALTTGRMRPAGESDRLRPITESGLRPASQSDRLPRQAGESDRLPRQASESDRLRAASGEGPLRQPGPAPGASPIRVTGSFNKPPVKPSTSGPFPVPHLNEAVPGAAPAARSTGTFRPPAERPNVIPVPSGPVPKPAEGAPPLPKTTQVGPGFSAAEGAGNGGSPTGNKAVRRPVHEETSSRAAARPIEKPLTAPPGLAAAIPETGPSVAPGRKPPSAVGDIPPAERVDAAIATVVAAGLGGAELGLFIGEIAAELINEGDLAAAIGVCERAIGVVEQSGSGRAPSSRQSLGAMLGTGEWLNKMAKILEQSVKTQGAAWSGALALRILGFVEQDPGATRDPGSPLGRIMAFAAAAPEAAPEELS